MLSFQRGTGMISPVLPISSPNLEALLFNLHQRVQDTASDLLPLFNIYAGEARFGAAVIAPDVNPLSSGSRILEIGAGILLLSCHLQREGYDVTAVEPVGIGFSHFDRLRRIVLGYAGDGGFAPALYSIPAENMEFMSEFDYAFSINAMEHVNDVAMVLRRVYAAIKPGRYHRFLCPNYLFPYEPHFNMPTLFSKPLTERFLRKYIRSSQSVVDPEGTWASLNWISVSQIRRICREELGVEPVFDRSASYRFIQRVLHDNDFQRRRGSMITGALQALDKMGITRLLLKIPAVCQPAMDCVIVHA